MYKRHYLTDRLSLQIQNKSTIHTHYTQFMFVVHHFHIYCLYFYRKDVLTSKQIILTSINY